jgi:hypothetical protein
MMGKTLASFLAFFMTLLAPVVFAQMPVTAPLGVSAGMEQIGVVAAARGKVELMLPGQVGRIAQSGQPVYMGDKINTDGQGNLQIMLLDETVFTIGPNTMLVIDEFVYDPKTQDGKVQASIAKGVFRYVSGKIAAKKPSNVTLKLPTATIGIRGTIVGGNVVPGGPSLAALLGPGANNNAGAQPGSFSITGTGQNPGQENVDHTGFGVTVGADGSVSGAFQLSEADINGLTAGLAPSGGGSDSGEGGGSATDQSGQGTFMTGENSNTAQGLNVLSDTNNETSTTAAQDAAADNESVANGITTIEQLSRISTGIFHYFGTGTYNPSGGSAGTMKAWCDIDFGSKTIGGGNSRVEISDSYGRSDQTQSGEQQGKSFANMSGPAVFTWTNAQGNYGTFDKIDLTLFNSGGVAAQKATVNVNYTQDMNAGPYGPGTGSGSASGERTAGPSSASPGI